MSIDRRFSASPSNLRAYQVGTSCLALFTALLLACQGGPVVPDESIDSTESIAGAEASLRAGPTVPRRCRTFYQAYFDRAGEPKTYHFRAFVPFIGAAYPVDGEPIGIVVTVNDQATLTPQSWDCGEDSFTATLRAQGTVVNPATGAITEIDAIQFDSYSLAPPQILNISYGIDDDTAVQGFSFAYANQPFERTATATTFAPAPGQCANPNSQICQLHVVERTLQRRNRAPSSRRFPRVEFGSCNTTARVGYDASGQIVEREAITDNVMTFYTSPTVFADEIENGCN